MFAAFVYGGAAVAGEPSDEQSRRAHAIASKVMSPFCPGSTVATCSSPRAAEWRSDIRKWVMEGLSEEEIRTRLQRRTPGRDLSGTPRTAFGWTLPLVLVGLGAILLLWLLRRFSRARPPAGNDAPAADDSRLDERLENELDRLDD
jgi:cytochrome c-type biogenesis protein CcmH/NrfF